jgi:hypothetical protein
MTLLINAERTVEMVNHKEAGEGVTGKGMPLFILPPSRNFQFALRLFS